MFIETRTGKTINGADITLTFAKSTNVYAFPCGRRRSSEVDKDGDLVNTRTDKYYFPFDPEARLNTEANNRKHSSLNGFTQTYLKEWDAASKKLLTVSLAGYLFKIALTKTVNEANNEPTELDYSSPNNFGVGVMNSIRMPAVTALEQAEKSGDIDQITTATNALEAVENATKIYANIVVEDVHLFSGFQEYFTGILRNQTEGDIPATSLDLLTTAAENTNDYDKARNFENYFFSGLSFSITPLTEKVQTKSYEQISVIIDPSTNKTVEKLVVSLCILERANSISDWQIHQPALLPKIEHGTTEDSIVIYGDTTLKGNNKELKVEGTVEVAGETAIRSNLKVDDNINVGDLTDDEKATADKGGCIVAKNNITAKRNLVVGNDLNVGANAGIIGDLEVTANATVKTSLVVGKRTEEDSTTEGDLTVKNHIETPTLEATTSITTPQGSITKANISTATIDESLTVHKNGDSAALAADNASITKDLTVKGTITANTTLAGEANNLIVNKADIETADINTLTGTTATIDDITGTNISSANMYQNGYNVPIIELVQSGTEYQLKISRTGAKLQN